MFFGKAGRTLKVAFINRLIMGCWPIGIPSIVTNVDKADLAVFNALYESPEPSALPDLNNECKKVRT